METRPDCIHIAYTIVFETPFHCGTGIREQLIDRTIVRDSRGYLYVPGTTFKGVLREHCEQLARLYEIDASMGKLIASPHDKEAALLGLGQKTTIITRIFGSPYHPGQLYFDDARQLDDAIKRYDGEVGDRHYLELQRDVYTQVRLDRPTRTAVEGALYTSEFGVRGLAFHGDIIGSLKCFPIVEISPNTPTYSLLLLLAGLRLIERLGGNKSAGKGKCQCEITRVNMNGKDVSWQSWFDHLGALADYSKQAVEEETS